MNMSPSRTLKDKEWFHGGLPREEAERLLVSNGDYLVRENLKEEDKGEFVLSVMWNEHKHFNIQETTEHKFLVEGSAFDTIEELIDHHHGSELPVTIESEAILYNPIGKWELNYDDVECGEVIGRGHFGVVRRAVLHSKGVTVAVKTCKIDLPEEPRNSLREARILQQYNHPNVVRLVGVCVQKQPIMIVMEYVPGSLLKYLRNNESLPTQTLLRMCLDCAAGMVYLASKGCIHRDLAARNCLVGDNDQVKISDFGLSREGDKYYLTHGLKEIPIKWTAQEAIRRGKYTSSSDIWSFGVLVWEISSLGGNPYPGINNRDLLEELDGGYRLRAPDGIPSSVYELALRCWETSPERRPHFNEIYEQLVAGILIRPESTSDNEWELSQDDVRCVEKIGNGFFGSIYRAFLEPGGITVGVKKCKVDLPEEQRNFLRDARILKQYDHPNIVRLVGVCVQKQPIMIVMEYVSGVTLLTHLRYHESISTRRLVKISRDCAAGMAYLASKGCIHGNLAARNCLVGENDVKISDFGLSRAGDEYFVTHGLRENPIRWTAPEALRRGEYTSLSDVWSFGVLLWEIFSLGRIPYAGIENKDLPAAIYGGYKLRAPDGIPPSVFGLMMMCMDGYCGARPHFAWIHERLGLVEEDS